MPVNIRRRKAAKAVRRAAHRAEREGGYHPKYAARATHEAEALLP